jgi:hypothetical protein
MTGIPEALCTMTSMMFAHWRMRKRPFSVIHPKQDFEPEQQLPDVL